VEGEEDVDAIIPEGVRAETTTKIGWLVVRMTMVMLTMIKKDGYGRDFFFVSRFFPGYRGGRCHMHNTVRCQQASPHA
jgi:hypothetical protein